MMRVRGRLLALTFLLNFAVIYYIRGLYFFTHDILGLSEAYNLALATGFGFMYILGARLSHPIAERFGERRTLCALILLNMLWIVASAAAPTPFVVAALFIPASLTISAMWPILQSYFSAGLPPREVSRALGRFNITWSISMPLAVLGTGPVLVSSFPAGVYVIPPVVFALALLATLGLPTRPAHGSTPDSSESDSAASLETDNLSLTPARVALMRRAAQWALVLSFALGFVLSPLLPEIFARLDQPTDAGTAWSSILELGRFIAFLAFGFTAGWHGKASWLWAALVWVPLGFIAVLLGPMLGVTAGLICVALGGLAFGYIGGVIYYKALYYSMLHNRGAVRGGGDHEAFIGLGFCLGPAAALLGQLIEPWTGDALLAVAIVMLPIMLAGVTLSLRPLLKAGSTAKASA